MRHFDGGPHAMSIFQRILRDALAFLKTGGILLFAGWRDQAAMFTASRMTSSADALPHVACQIVDHDVVTPMVPETISRWVPSGFGLPSKRLPAKP